MKYYITTAIDYINGKPHIGHSYEKVAADVLARFYRLGGADVFFLTGTDEHGTKVAQFAEKQGMSPEKFADENAGYFKTAWDNLDISYDRFVRTTDADHIAAVNLVMEKMKAGGFLYEGEYTGLYCTGHEAFLTEKELVNGLCPDHHTKPELLTEKNWFLKVSEFTGKIQAAIEADDFVITPHERKEEVLGLLKQGFNDIAISRPNVKWGIPLPWDSTQTVYVWVDALINYISGVGFAGGTSADASGANSAGFKKFWPADAHVIGKDIIKFHCIIWPAILLACGLEMPKSVIAHGYLTVDNQKISKTIGNVIDPNQWVTKYGADAVRYFLMREISWGNDGDVSESKLAGRYQGDLADGLGNLVSRLTNMIEKNCGGKVPEIVRAHHQLDEVSDLIKACKFHEALAKIWESVAWANKHIDQTKPWEVAKTNPDLANQILSDIVAQVEIIGLRLAPFMPATAEKIRLALQGEQITKINNLFPRIE